MAKALYTRSLAVLFALLASGCGANSYVNVNLRLEEAAGSFSLPPDPKQQFTPVSGGQTRWPVSDHRRLFRFEVDSNDSRTVLLEVYRVMLDRVEVMSFSGGRWSSMVSGRSAVNARSVQYQYPVFLLPLSPGKNVFYIFVQHQGTLVLPLYVWELESFLQEAKRRDLIEGSHYGALILLVFYHLAMFLVIREKDFLLYFFTMAAHLFMHVSITGTASLFVWGGSFELNRRLPFIAHSLLLIATPYFARSFFQLKTRAPFLHDGLTSLIVIGIVLMPASVFFDYLTLSYVHYGANLYGQVLAFATLALMMVKGDWMVRLFLISRILMSAGDFSFMMRELGYLSWGFSVVDRVFIYVGGAAASMFLTLVIAARYKALKLANEQDSEQLRRRDTFIRFLSHELKAPLAGLRMVLDALKQPDLTEDRKNRMVDMMQASINNHLEFLDQASKLERLRRSDFTVRTLPVEVAQVCSRVLAELEGQAAAKGVALDHSVPAGTTISTDPDLLEEILKHLIRNGIQFTAPGGRVSIQWKSPELIVMDTGVGMDDAIKARLFREPGKTTLGTAGEKGHGLGLAYCDTAMGRLGGSIRAESEPGRGTRIILRFGGRN